MFVEECSIKSSWASQEKCKCELQLGTVDSRKTKGLFFFSCERRQSTVAGRHPATSSYKTSSFLFSQVHLMVQIGDWLQTLNPWLRFREGSQEEGQEDSSPSWVSSLEGPFLEALFSNTYLHDFALPCGEGGQKCRSLAHRSPTRVKPVLC